MLSVMSGKAKEAMGTEHLEVVADKGYFSGEEILACGKIGVSTPTGRQSAKAAG